MLLKQNQKNYDHHQHFIAQHTQQRHMSFLEAVAYIHSFCSITILAILAQGIKILVQLSESYNFNLTHKCQNFTMNSVVQFFFCFFKNHIYKAYFSPIPLHSQIRYCTVSLCFFCLSSGRYFLQNDTEFCDSEKQDFSMQLENNK